ncbi:uncharacterized protein [Montipora foliosa]|uniref:uncharacterized protein n=1 Tax=Montipora foliosa TaxID=591990 RepID=UPI0035F144DF
MAGTLHLCHAKILLSRERIYSLKGRQTHHGGDRKIEGRTLQGQHSYFDGNRNSVKVPKIPLLQHSQPDVERGKLLECPNGPRTFNVGDKLVELIDTLETVWIETCDDM